MSHVMRNAQEILGNGLFKGLHPNVPRDCQDLYKAHWLLSDIMTFGSLLLALSSSQSLKALAGLWTKSHHAVCP